VAIAKMWVDIAKECVDIAKSWVEIARPRGVEAAQKRRPIGTSRAQVVKRRKDPTVDDTAPYIFIVSSSSSGSKPPQRAHEYAVGSGAGGASLATWGQVLCHRRLSII
jgi:hypothetical protein